MPLKSVTQFSKSEYYAARDALLEEDNNLQPAEGQPEPAPELDPTLAAAPEVDGNFVRGLKGGVDNMQALGGGLKALAGSVIGNKEMVAEGMEYYQEQTAEAEQYKPDSTFQEIDSATDFGAWAAYTIGSVVPDLVGMVGTGGAGGLLAKSAVKQGVTEMAETLSRQATERMIKEGIEDQAAEKIARNMADKFAKAKIKKMTTRGATAGAFTYGTQQGASSTFARTLEETGEEAPVAAAVSGLTIGALNALPAFSALTKFLPKGKVDEAGEFISGAVNDKPAWVGEFVKDVTTQMGVESGTEALQLIVEEEVISFVNNNYTESESREYFDYISNERKRSSLIEASAAGFLFGGGTGVVGAGVKGATGGYNADANLGDDAKVVRTRSMNDPEFAGRIRQMYDEARTNAANGVRSIPLGDQSFLDDNPPLTNAERREAGLTELTNYNGTDINISDSDPDVDVPEVTSVAVDQENKEFGENTLPPSPQSPEADIVTDFPSAPMFGGRAVPQGKREFGSDHRWDAEISPAQKPVQEQLLDLSVKANSPEALDPNNTDVIVEAIDQDDIDRIFDRNDSIQIPTTQKPKGKSLPTIEEAYGDRAEDATNTLAGVMADLSANGVPTSFMDQVSGVYVHKEAEIDAPALTGKQTRGISVNEDLINGSMTDQDVLGELAWTMTHEIYHAADFSMGLSDKDSRFGIQIDESIDEPTVVMGDIMEEIYDNWEQGSALGKRFDYPFNDLQAHILDPEKDNAKVNSTMREEVFAQLGALFHSNPKELQELAPQAYNYIKEIRDNNLQTAQAVEVNDEAPTSISTPDTSQPEGISGEVRAPPESRSVEVVQPESAGRDGEASTGDGRADTPVAGQVQEEAGQRERSDVQKPSVKGLTVSEQTERGNRLYTAAQGDLGTKNGYYTERNRKNYVAGYRDGYQNKNGLSYKLDDNSDSRGGIYSEGYLSGSIDLRRETDVSKLINIKSTEDTPVTINLSAKKPAFKKAENWEDTGTLTVTFSDGDRYQVYFDEDAADAEFGALPNDRNSGGEGVYYQSIDGKIFDDYLGTTKKEALQTIIDHREKLFAEGKNSFNTPLDPQVSSDTSFKAYNLITDHPEGKLELTKVRKKFNRLEDNQFDQMIADLIEKEGFSLEDGVLSDPEAVEERLADERMIAEEAEFDRLANDDLDDTSFILSYKPPRRTKNGKYVGSPAGINTPAKLARIRRFVKELAEQGEYGRFWYERSGRTILEITGGDVEEAKKIVQAIAITSPSTPVDTNYEYAIQAYYQWKNDQPIETGRFPKSMGEKITKVFNGESWSGRKTNNFEQNLLRAIDDSLDQGVTTDLWMMRAFGYTSDAATDLNYDFVENETIRIAEDLGWEPQQVQAAIWVEIKSRMESKQVKAEVDKKSELKGNYKWVTEKGKKIRKFKDLDAEKAHSTLWVNTALNYNPTEPERNTAKFDYRDATLNKMAQISVESIPSTKSGHLPEIFNASQGEILEYHHAIEQSFLDDDGVDIVAKELGLLQMGKSQGIGAWEGRNDPVTQNEIVLPRQYREKNDGVVSDDANDLVAAYAAVKGTLLKQDGVGWHRPFFKKSNTKASQNGMHVSIGRPLNMRETRELSAALGAYGLGGNIVSTQDGVRVINYGDESGTPYSGLPNFQTGKNKLDFKDAIINSVEAMSFDGDLNAEVVGFVSANDLLENDWTENKNGEGYLQGRLRERPDLQRRVSSLITQLQPRIREVEAEFAGTYGWTRNHELNRDFGGIVDEPSFVKKKINNAKNNTLDDGTPSTNRFSYNDEIDGQSDLARRLKGKKIYRSLVDRYAPLEDFENQAADFLDKGRLPAGLSARDQENLSHGKIQNDLDAFHENYVDPLGDLIAELKVDPDSVGIYLIAKHAAERNDVIAEKVKAQRERNILRTERQIEKLQEDVEVDHTVQIANLQEKLQSYKTLPLQFQDTGSGMTYAEAESVLSLADREGTKADMDRIADKVYEMLQFQRDRMVEAGLLDGESKADWEDTYEFYVPLKGFAAEEDGDKYVRSSSSRGFSIVGSESMKAKGRKTLPVNPLFTAIEDVQRKIIRARKNETAQTLLDLLSNLGNSDSYTIYNNKFRPPKPSDELTMQDLDQMSRDIRPNGDPKYVEVKKGGQTFFIEFRSDSLNHALQNMSVPMLSRANDDVSKVLTLATRFQTFRRNMLINYNPSWGLVNPLRDVQTGLMYALSSKDKLGSRVQGENLIGKMAASYLPSMRSMYRVMRGKPVRENTLDQYASEFMEDGASTGMMLVRDQDEQLRILKSKLKKGYTREALRAIGKWVEDFNTTMENSVRLSAYVEARKAGTDRETAATLAKDLTVNFNRKGENTAVVNAGFLFFNAAVQGNVNIAQALSSDTGKATTAQKTAAGLIALGGTLAAINILMSDDDDDDEKVYADLPEHAKNRSLLFMYNSDEGFALPASYGYNFFTNIGRLGVEMSFGVNTPEESALYLWENLLLNFVPVAPSSGDSWEEQMRGFYPDLLEVHLDMLANKNFFGSDIYIEQNPFIVERSNAYNSRRSTDKAFTAAAEFLNDATGGDKYTDGFVSMNPDKMEYVYEYFLGGVGRFVSQSSDVSARMMADEDFRKQDLPIVGTFFESPSEYEDRFEFYANWDESRKIEAKLKDAVEAGDQGELVQLRNKYQSFIPVIEGGRNSLYKMSNRDLRNISKTRKIIERQDIPEDRRKEMLDELLKNENKIFDIYNKAYRKAEKGIKN